MNVRRIIILITMGIIITLTVIGVAIADIPDTITYNNIIYSLDHNDKKASVIWFDNDNVTNFTIPATIKVNKTKYKVVAYFTGRELL